MSAPFAHQLLAGTRQGAVPASGRPGQGRIKPCARSSASRAASLTSVLRLVRSSYVRHGPQRVRSRRQAAHATQAPIHAGSSPSRHACSQQTRRRRRKRSHLGDDKSHRSHHGLFVNIQPGTTLMQDLLILHQSAAGEGSSIQRILVRVLHGPVDRLATISWAPRSHGPTQDQANCTRELPTSVPTARSRGGAFAGVGPAGGQLR